ncbi:hypothetical protein ACGFZB_13135 [Streptomyces cinerochromogenes]|uniref:Translation initiation factor IF-2 n=1 Tax=Streptomyces cinerochromogenes TaxID=66422 RepID=A0ABW7B5L2_9ACTN
MPAEPAESVEADPGSVQTDALSGPDDVTVQLEDVCIAPVGARSAVGEPGAAGGEVRGAGGPVFVDASGRRSRRFRRLGVAVGVACAGYAAVIVATLLSGNSAAPWLPVPGQREDKPAGKVDTSPLPSASTTPTPPGTGAVTGPAVGAAATGTAVPGSGAPADAAGADASATAEPTPGTSTAPGATDSASPAVPTAGESPAPSATGTATAPAPTPTPTGPAHTPPGRTRHPHPKLSL